MGLTFSNTKPFWITLILVFFMVLLSRLDLARPALVIPQTTEQNEVWKKVKPKLNQGIVPTGLSKNSLIPTSYASSVSSAELEDLSAYLVIEPSSGEVISDKNSTAKLPVASLTKIMTAVVSLDLASTDELFTISQRASRVQPTSMGLIEGQKWSMEELLNSLLLTSANDAAEALKEGINEKYQGEIFIRAMNEKAKILGLKNTSFTNPQGFDDQDNFSSAEDLANLTRYALANYPLFRQIVAKDYQFYPQSWEHKQADLYNWNGLLGVYPNIQGIKIGNTEQAGNTTVVLSEREGKNILVVLLGAKGVLQRDLLAARLLDLGYASKYGLNPVNMIESQLQEKYASWKYWD